MKKTHILIAILIVATFSCMHACNLQTVQASSEPSTYALDFDKSDNSLVTIPDDSSLNPVNEISIMFWFKMRSYDWVLVENGIINKFVNWGTEELKGGYLIFIDAWSETEPMMGFEVHLTATSVELVDSDNPMPIEEWTHVCGTAKVGGKMFLYINGSVQSHQPNIASMNGTTYMLQFGNWTANFDGQLDEVTIWSRALNTTEISNAYNSGVGQYEPLNKSGIEGWWKMSKGSGSTLYDKSGNQNHGTIGAGCTWVSGFAPDWKLYNPFYLQSDYFSTLSTIEYSADILTFHVSAPSASTSTTKIYCATYGKPDTVIGASAWEYDSSIQICTVRVVHASDAEIKLDWSGGTALGTYPLTVSVLQNGVPTLATIVIAGGENKTVFGLTTFELPYGNYFILVYCGDQRQTKSIMLSGPSSVGFDFIVTEPPSWGGMIWILPALLLVGIVLYFMLFRKRG